jgi:hypothetical protein
MTLRRDSVHGNAVGALPLLHSQNRSQLSLSKITEGMASPTYSRSARCRSFGASSQMFVFFASFYRGGGTPMLLT